MPLNTRSTKIESIHLGIHLGALWLIRLLIYSSLFKRRSPKYMISLSRIICASPFAHRISSKFAAIIEREIFSAPRLAESSIIRRISASGIILVSSGINDTRKLEDFSRFSSFFSQSLIELIKSK